jgi:hypothetical protein
MPWHQEEVPSLLNAASSPNYDPPGITSPSVSPGDGNGLHGLPRQPSYQPAWSDDPWAGGVVYTPVGGHPVTAPGDAGAAGLDPSDWDTWEGSPATPSGSPDKTGRPVTSPGYTPTDGPVQQLPQQQQQGLQQQQQQGWVPGGGGVAAAGRLGEVDPSGPHLLGPTTTTTITVPSAFAAQAAAGPPLGPASGGAAGGAAGGGGYGWSLKQVGPEFTFAPPHHNQPQQLGQQVAASGGSGGGGSSKHHRSQQRPQPSSHRSSRDKQQQQVDRKERRRSSSHHHQQREQQQGAPGAPPRDGCLGKVVGCLVRGVLDPLHKQRLLDRPVSGWVLGGGPGMGNGGNR